MPLWTPPGPCFQSRITNFTGRPSATLGTSVTAGASNSKGSWTEVIGGASVTHDVYLAVIGFANANVSAGACEGLADLGVDYNNGGSYTVKVNNLQHGHAAGWDGGATLSGAIGGIQYVLPLFFPAGTQFAVRAQTNNGSTRVVRVALHLYGKPKYPHLARAGAYCDTFGADTSTSKGAAVTPGTVSEGSYTDIKGSDTTKPYWFWEMGMSLDDTTMTDDAIYAQDLAVGDGSNKHLVIEDQFWVSNAQECLSKDGTRAMLGVYDVGSGVRPYIRSQCSTTPDSNMTCCVYAIGG